MNREDFERFHAQIRRELFPEKGDSVTFERDEKLEAEGGVEESEPLLTGRGAETCPTDAPPIPTMKWFPGLLVRLALWIDRW